MKKKPQLKKKDIDKKLKDLSEWKVSPKYTMISRTFKLPTFVSGLAFVAKIAVHAEVSGHHPDIELSYGEVKVKLTTHDAGGLTKKDFDLAKRIDGLKV